MYSLVLFNLIIIIGFAGNYPLLAFAVIANIIAFAEYRVRRDLEESKRLPATRRYSKLTP